MAAKAVVVRDPSGQPLANVEPVYVQGNSEYRFPLTNQDGYSLALESFVSGSGYLKIVANGFKSYLQVISLDDNNQEIHINVPGGQPNTIHLPSLSFSKPSRERIISVMANLCNITDAFGLPIFEPFISTLFFQDKLRANDWVDRLKSNGSTHITVELTGDYDEFLPWLGSRYPIIGLDMTNDLGNFMRFLDWILSNDLIPIVKSGADGQSYSPGGKTYGWAWGMQQLPGIYDTLAAYKNLCLWSTSYDGGFPDWSPDQLLAFLKMMRNSLGIDACIDAEFGSGPGESISYCHLGNGSADWTPDKLGDLDSFSLELQSFAQSPAEIAGQIEGMTEVFQRVGPGGSYLHNDKTKVGMYETVAYWAIRKYSDFEQARAIANRAYNVGYRTFGNGLPL